ncbi:MAG: TDP-N-acetylfucosamine:lipid II N-acetylfucosaminyltransferase, partial [Pseudothermotoga sp.]
MKIMFKLLKSDGNFSWVLWGAELYNYYLKSKHSPAEWLYNEVKKLFVRNAYSVIALSEEDYHFARQKFGTNAKYSYAFYPNVVSFENLDYAMARNKKEKQTRKILIGNSASETNNHFEILQSLTKLNINDNFEILCP